MVGGGHQMALVSGEENSQNALNNVVPLRIVTKQM